MATHSRLSKLLEGVLLTTLLLSLSFSSCNATSRNVQHTDLMNDAGPQGSAAVAHSAANSCAGREKCQMRSTLEQDVDMMDPAELTHSQVSSMDSADAMENISDQHMGHHDDDHDENSEWTRESSEHQNMMDHMEHSRDSNTLREDDHQTSKRDSDWMRGHAVADRHLSENLENMRFQARIGRMSDSERMSDSADTMSDIDKRVRKPRRLIDSQSAIEEPQNAAVWSTEKMRDFHSSEMRDSHRMIDSDSMRDSHKMADSDMMMHSHARLGDSQNMRTAHQMYPGMDHEWSRNSEEMLNSESRANGRVSDRWRDSNQMMDQQRLADSSHNLRNSAWRSAAANIGNNQDQQSEMMQDSHRTRPSGRTVLEHTREATNNMIEDAAAAQGHESNFNAEQGLQAGSEMMGGHAAEQINHGHHRRGAMESIPNSDHNMQHGSEQTSANSQHRMRNSNGVHHSRVGLMERQSYSSAMEANSCQGAHQCRSTSNLHNTNSRAMDHNSMPISSRRSNAEIVGGTQLENSEASNIHSSIATGRCSSGMNAGDCQAAHDGDLQNSQNMHISNSDCRLGGADCQMTPKGEANNNNYNNNNAQSMETTQSTTPGRMSSCSNDHCHMASSAANNNDVQPMNMAERQHHMRNDREIVVSPKWVKMERTSAINEANGMDNSQQMSPMANQGMARSADAETNMQANHYGHFASIDHAERRNSENMMQNSNMQHSSSKHWTRSSAEINGASSSCANGADCRRTSGIMHMSQHEQRDHSEQVGHEHKHEEMINGHPSACTNGADCKRTTSTMMPMSPMDSGLMGHDVNINDEEIIHGSGSCTNGADCKRTSEIMHMSARDHSEMMGHNDNTEMAHNGANWNSENGDLNMDHEMADNSKMMERRSDQMNASAEMMHDHNSDEAAAHNLPIHRGN
ncbi:unnamed protein product [Calypogeia fissa]